MKQRLRDIATPIIIILVAWVPFFMGAFDKDKPAVSTSLRSSNPEILANWSQLQTGIDNEHIFTGTSAGTQTGDHTQGSARCFSQASAPATRIDGSGFLSTDLGSLWVDTDDNAVYVLTATAPTWTPVSTEIIATLLAAGRVFGSTLGVTSDFAVNTNKFTVAAASGNTLVAGTLDITGNIDPTSYDTANGGFLDEDAMGSDSATKVASQQSIKAYIDTSLFRPVDGVPTEIFVKFITGTAGAATVNEAHGLSFDDILSVTVAIKADDSVYQVGEQGLASSNQFFLRYDATNIILSNLSASMQGGTNPYRIRIEHK